MSVIHQRSLSSILHRRTRHGDFEFSVHRLGCVGKTDTGRLDLLRFIEEQHGELNRAEVPIKISQSLVGREYPIGGFESPQIKSRAVILVHMSKEREPLAKGLKADSQDQGFAGADRAPQASYGEDQSAPRSGRAAWGSTDSPYLP